MARMMKKTAMQLEGIESFSSLNSLDTLPEIVDKFPDKTKGKWIEWLFRVKKEYKTEATSRYLVYFV